MRTRTIQRCLIWLLPLLVLRAMVPAGFMLMASNGELQMMLCSGMGAMQIAPMSESAGVIAPQRDHAHHEHHALRGHPSSPADVLAPEQRDERPQAHDNSLCPFAVAGTSAPLLANVTESPATPVASPTFDLERTPPPDSPLRFLNRIRGPPRTPEPSPTTVSRVASS